MEEKIINQLMQINVNFSKETRKCLTRLSTFPTSPFHHMDKYTNNIDKLLFIFFKAFNSKDFSIKKMENIKRDFNKENNKGGEVSLASSKITQLPELLISSYLALYPEYDLRDLFQNEEGKKGIDEIKKDMKIIIENTIELGVKNITDKMLKNEIEQNCYPTLTFFSGKFKKFYDENKVE